MAKPGDGFGHILGLAALAERTQASPRLAQAHGHGASHMGFNEARRHCVDADALLGKRRCPGLSQANQPSFAGRIVGLPTVAGDAADRSQQGDAGVRVQRAVIEQGLGQHLRSLEVHRQHGVPIFGGHVRQGLVTGDACVVHQDVEAIGQGRQQLFGGVTGANVQC